MATDENEEELLRSVALQNAKSILAARQRMERELVEAKEALERKNEELIRAKGRFENIFNQAAAGIAVADKTGRWIMVNPRLCEILNYTSEELLEIGFSQVTHPDDLAADLEMLRRLLSREVPVDRREKRYLRKDGTVVWVQVNLTVERDPMTAQESFLSVILDITDRKRVEQSLRESEARYRSALTVGRMGNWETDIVEGTRTWSEAGMALFGLALVDGRGRVGGEADEFALALHPDDRYLVQELHELANRQDSFPAEYRIVRPDGTIRWLSGRGQVVVRGIDGKAQRLVSIMVDVTDRRAAEDHIQFLMREISHRSKNLLSVVQAIAAQTGRSAGTVDEFQVRFSGRLRGLAASHDLLVHQNWQGATLADLVRDQLAPFVEVGNSRLNIVGPDVLVSPEAAEAIGLALHELATNAVKYGALSVPIGQVTVSWALEDRGTEPRRLRLSWVERGGPIVTPPPRKGFGHVVFERIVAESLSGEVAIDFAPKGLSWELSIPITNLVTERTTPEHGPHQAIA